MTGAFRRNAKVFISVFIVVNLVTVAYVNRSSGFDRTLTRSVLRKIPSQAAFRIHQTARLILSYAHLTGLWSQWVMFGRVGRVAWRFFDVKARTEDGSVVLLPLPKQGSRTFWQRNFFDFRERKFHNNLYGSDLALWRYARHLCRRFPTWDGGRVEEILFAVETRRVRDPIRAAEAGGHLDPEVNTWVRRRFSCVPGR